MSEAQRKFLKKLKLRKYFVITCQILIVIGFFGLWEFLASKNLINTFVFSKPSEIIKTILGLIESNNLFNHIFATLNEVLIAFVLGILLGFIIAIILYEIPILAQIIDPFLSKTIKRELYNKSTESGNRILPCCSLVNCSTIHFKIIMSKRMPDFWTPSCTT